MHGTLDRQTWSAAMVSELQRLIEKKYSASQAAVELSLSRNAVIGKAHRLGWKFGSESSHNVFSPVRLKKLREPPPKLPKIKSARLPQVAPEPNALRITFDRMAATTSCKWPVGEYPYHYCGHTPVAGKPYCAHHCLRAYEPPKARARDARPR